MTTTVPQDPNAARLRVALVDDDPMWRYLTGTALRERGWQVSDFESGFELLEELAGLQADLVLVDAMMPALDGFETCRRIRQACGPDLPLLMLTSLDDESSIRSAYDAGANDFFIKSTHWSLLVERIRHLVDVVETASRLRRTDARLAQVHSAALAGTFDFDFRTRLLSGSPGSFSVAGFHESRTQLHEQEFRRVIDPQDLPRLDAAITEAIRTRSGFACEIGIKVDDAGCARQLQIDGRPEIDARGRLRGMRCVASDTTERSHTREQIRRLSSHDALTGLPNRESFLARLGAGIEDAAQSEQRVAVAVIDLDRFTQINEMLGQVAGDDLLRQVGARVASSILKPDAGLHGAGAGASHRAPMVARLPGDEFALMFPEVRSISEIAETLAQMTLALQRPFELAGTECFVSASVGVALFPRDGDTAGVLLSRADRAAREVKARGRNDIAWFRPSERDDSRNRLELIAGLHKALERNEFEVHFQPWVDLASGRVTGLEALLRWRRGGRQVPPVEFIPVAEDTGMIVPIGEWVLQHASEMLALWRKQGLELERVAINVPTAHFERESLLTTLRAAMHLNGLAHQSIELELTETCMVRDFERTLPRLEALIDAGATLAIDDFGTGYSSLAYLTRLPISKLKVDRAFVNQLGVSQQGGAVCRAIVALGQSLGVQVLAEGVETVEQAKALLGLGCRLMQGFLFARPVPPAQIGIAIASAQAMARRVLREHAAAGSAAGASARGPEVPTHRRINTPVAASSRESLE